MKGYFFGIKSNAFDKIFIGFSKNPVCLRKATYAYRHRQWVKDGRPEQQKCFLFELLDQEDAEYFTIEQFEYDEEQERRERETVLKKQLLSEDKLANVKMPILSEDDKSERNRQRAKRLYLKKISEPNAEAFKEQRNINAKKWYQKNREATLAKHREDRAKQQKCQCGSTVTCDMAKHINSLIHKNNMLKLSNGSTN